MKSENTQSLDRILESAVIVSWTDLVWNTQSKLIQIEYGFAPSGTVDYLKVWSAIEWGIGFLPSILLKTRLRCQSLLSHSPFPSDLHLIRFACGLTSSSEVP